MNKIHYLHYIFKRNSENLIPESIVNRKDDDFEEDFDEFSERGQREQIKIAYTINEKKQILLKLEMMILLKCLRPDLFIDALLERIKLTKEVFIFDVE